MSGEVPAAIGAVFAAFLALVGVWYNTVQQKRMHDTQLERQGKQHEEQLGLQRKQHDELLGQQRLDSFSDRFGRASEQLGSRDPLIRLGGVGMLAALADQWPDHRRQCVEMLCAYLRLPPRAGEAGQENHVRNEIVRLFRERLQKDNDHFHGLSFDLTGAHFPPKTSFEGAVFSGFVLFDRAKFTGETWFTKAKFTSSAAFNDAVFHGPVGFYHAEFSDGPYFGGARFERAVDFRGCIFNALRADNSIFEKSVDMRASEGDKGRSVHFKSGAWFQDARLAQPIDLAQATADENATFTQPDGTTRDLGAGHTPPTIHPKQPPEYRESPHNLPS